MEGFVPRLPGSGLMARLKYLDDWVGAVLSTPRSSLDILFQYENVVEGSINSMPFFTAHRAGFRRVQPRLLQELHAHLRGGACEVAIWNVLPTYLEHALPDEVANDLIDRSIATFALSHSRQSDAVMWRLCPLADEAILTLAKEAYTWPDKSLADLLQVLEAFPHNDWMLQSLAHSLHSSMEKRAAWKKAIADHPEREAFLQIEPRHIFPKPGEKFWLRDAPRPLDAEGAALLFYSSDASHLLPLAREPETPIEVLEELSELHNAPDAAAIRHAARINLRENHGQEVEP